jgi:hypothetical protein
LLNAVAGTIRHLCGLAGTENADAINAWDALQPIKLKDRSAAAAMLKTSKFDFR